MSTEETIVRTSWPPLPEWKPNWLDKRINEITRYSFTINKTSNEYSQENPDYVEGVVVLALHHICWILPILFMLLVAQWTRFRFRPPGTLVITLRICICLCVSSIVIVAVIQLFLYILLVRIPPVFSLHPQNNEEINIFMLKFNPKINKIKEDLQAGYIANLSEVDGRKMMLAIDPIDKIVYAGETMMSLYRNPSFKRDITSCLTVKLLEGSWIHFNIFMGLWIFALMCILMASILQPYFAGAVCGISWCGIGAVSVTWVAVQLADACMLPKNAIKSLPYDSTYKEMHSILMEYERLCKEFDYEFWALFSHYRDRFEEARDVINKVNNYNGQLSTWEAVNTQQYYSAMASRVDLASSELMGNNLTLTCKYNFSIDNKNIPTHLPEYDRVIRYVCHGARRLQLLVLQILILMFSPLVCFFILIYAIFTMKAATCPSAPCRSRRKIGRSGNKCSDIISCGPCSLHSDVACSDARKCGGTEPDSKTKMLPKKHKGETRKKHDETDKSLIVNSICNPINMACEYQPFPYFRKLSLSNPVSYSKICSGVVSAYSRKSCAGKDNSCDTILRSESVKKFKTRFNCCTCLSLKKLKLNSALTSRSICDMGPACFVESEATGCALPVSLSKKDICNVPVSKSNVAMLPSSISESEYRSLNACVSSSIPPTFTNPR